MAPSEAARPAVAVTAALPRPGELTTPAPEPMPVFKTDPDIWKLCANAPVAVPSEFISGLAEPSNETPEVAIDADVAAPETTLVPAVAAVADVAEVEDVTLVAEDTGDADDEDDAIVDTSPCRAPGIAAELSGDTVWALVPAEVPTAWVTAAASPDSPDELVDSTGVGKGVRVDAAVDAPAYPYMATASCTHIST